MTRPIRRLLVANRGEIARRIQRTAHAMGIDTVAVYADGDAMAPFVREATVAVALRGTSATDTYLDVAKVLAAAARAGADAVHPGYGFLSENAGFAQAVIDAGLAWVGPSPKAIAAMGDKLEAKKLLSAAGVPSLDAPEGHFPVLVKAAMGGGGKGMRVVSAAAELAEALAGARREAQAAFGDDTVFLERYLTGARHVEVQILGDSHGNLVHLGERECSIQRRHQKVIEEAPSPAVDASLREALGEAALKAARAIGYENAGTVEFLLDGREFFFLEVNTRLQVEHPVTEMVTGLDLVREQLLVTQGAPLAFTQDEVVLRGHAVEARLYAEDPANDFLPVTGTVVTWEPAPGARFDSGIESGSVIGVEFDPMLAKVVTHAPTRTEAALALALALERTAVQGTVTNRDFLVGVLRHEAFLAGDTTTDFIDRVDPPRAKAVYVTQLEHCAVLAALTAASWRRAASPMGRFPAGWRNGFLPAESFGYRHGSHDLVVSYRARRDGAYDVTAGENAWEARVLSVTAGGIEAEIDGVRHRTAVRSAGDRWWVGEFELTLLPRFPSKEKELVEGGLVAPLPGGVISVGVAAGDSVTAGQLLVVVEAMKMEHRITAPADGTVDEVRVSVGQQVAAGDLLVVLS
ncbi:MAG: acety-l/propionyl-CoA carboxylase subunit alpha [Frankiales bacterium]|nr:acety-l/propionyl-CoA carboxylase subunit alpha [Frankiales bacterium]